MPTDYKNLGKRQGGDPNIMRLKEVNKIRPLDNTVAGWRQHAIEHPSDSEQFASMVCPGARSCPLCRKPVSADGKPYFPISRRFAANVWDYDTNEVKVLVAGPAVFDPFKEAAMVGIDPATCDWTITKSGRGKATDYTVIRHDASAFTAAAITPDMLHSVDKYEQPATTEAIFEVLDKFGIDYDALTVPQYTIEEALAFKMPYTKHKGLTIEQMVTQDLSYAQWMHGTKLEQGQLGDPVFVALQTVLEERGLVPPLEDALSALPEPEPQQASGSAPTVNQAPTSAPPATVPSPVVGGLSDASASLVPLIGPDGIEVMVPPVAVDAMLLSGFSHPAPPTTSVDANAPMRVIIGGNEVELPREQALMLIEAGTAERIEEAPPEPEPPKLPLPDEIVQVAVNGVGVPMPYVQAAQVVDTGAASFVDPAVAEAHERANQLMAQRTDPTPSPEPSSASTAPAATPSSAQASDDDPEKPHKCEQCGARYKTPGALTQHKNREHKVSEPQPSAVPASSNGDGDIRERTKELIAHAPFAKDFTKLLAIFEEETGEKNFTNMDEAQLAKLEVRLTREIAQAAA